MTFVISILGVGFGAFCVWMVLRTVNRKERWTKRKLATSVGIRVTIVLFSGTAGWLWWNWFLRDHVWQIRFEPVAWRRADPIGNHRTVRSQMIDDLLETHDFRGWSRSQIEETLGPPEPEEGLKCGFPQFDVIYLLGLERGGAFSLDDEALGFSFDENGKVVNFGRSVN